MLARKLVKLSLQGVNLETERRNSLVSILLNLFNSYNLPLKRLSLFKEPFVHLLQLVALHFVLLLQRQVLL